MITWLNRILQVRAGEWRLVVIAGGLLAFSIGATILFRIVNDAIFLGQYDAKMLPYVIAASSLAMAAASLLYGALGERVGHKQLAILTPIAFAVLLAISRLLLNWNIPGWIFLQYVVLWIVGGLLPILAWNLVANISDSRQLRRLIPLFGAIGSIGAAAAGLLTRVLSDAIGTDNLLWVGAFVVGVYLLFARAAVAAEPDQIRRPIKQRVNIWKSTKEGVGLIHRNKLMRLTTLAAICSFVVVTIVDFQFKTSLKDQYPDKDEMSAFLGNFYAASSILALVLQLTVSGWLMNRFGLSGSFPARPIVIIAIGAFAVAGFGFWSFAILRLVDMILLYAWYDLGAKIVYAPIPAERGNRIKLTQDGAIKPIVVIAASALLIVLTPLIGLAYLTWIPLAFAAIWLFSAVRIKPRYVAELGRAIDRRLFTPATEHDFERVENQETLSYVRRMLGDADADRVRFALLVTEKAAAEPLWNDVVQCLAHGDARVRRTAATTLTRINAPRAADPLRIRLTTEPDADTLAELLHHLTELEDEPSLEFAFGKATDERLDVCAAALVMLFRLGGLDGIITAVEQISRLRDGSEEQRIVVARIVGRLGVRHLDRTLSALLTDPEPRVRKTALRAVASAGSDQLLRQVARMLEDDEWREAAEHALIDAGPRGVAVVCSLASGDGLQPPVLISAARILRAHPNPAGAKFVHRWLKSAAPAVRLESARTLLAFQETEMRLDLSLVRGFFELELRLLYAFKVGVSRQTGLLRRELEHRFRMCVERLFLALRLLYRARELQGVLTTLEGNDEKAVANAIEFLDNTLRDHTEKLLIPMLEQLPIEEAYRKARVALDLPPFEEQDLSTLAADDSWLRLLLDEEVDPAIDRDRLRIAMRLAALPTFRSLDIQTLYTVALHGEVRESPADTTLVEAGQPAGAHLVILEGGVELRSAEGTNAPASDDPPRTTLGADQEFGAIETLAGDRSPFTARTSEPTRCFVLTREAWRELYSRDAAVAHAVIARLLHALREANDTEAELRKQMSEVA